MLMWPFGPLVQGSSSLRTFVMESLRDGDPRGRGTEGTWARESLKERQPRISPNNKP